MGEEVWGNEKEKKKEGGKEQEEKAPTDKLPAGPSFRDPSERGLVVIVSGCGGGTSAAVLVGRVCGNRLIPRLERPRDLPGEWRGFCRCATAKAETTRPERSNDGQGKVGFALVGEQSRSCCRAAVDWRWARLSHFSPGEALRQPGDNLVGAATMLSFSSAGWYDLVMMCMTTACERAARDTERAIWAARYYILDVTLDVAVPLCASYEVFLNSYCTYGGAHACNSSGAMSAPQQTPSSTPSASSNAGSSSPSSAAKKPSPPARIIFAVPGPIKKLFDLVPVLVYPPNELPQRSPKPSKTPTLYIFSTPEDAAAGRPSFNPSCLKWQTFLKIAGIDHRVVPSNNHASPTGILPFLLPAYSSLTTSQETLLPVPSSKLIKYAKEHGGRFAEIDDIRYEAYQSLLDHRIRNAWLFALYLEPSNFDSIVVPLYIASQSRSSLVRFPSAQSLRAAAESELRKRSTSGVIDVDDLYSEADKAFEALSILLGKDNWFSRSERPGLFDASVFAYTELLLDESLGGHGGWQEGRLGRALETGLEKYLEKQHGAAGLDAIGIAFWPVEGRYGASLFSDEGFQVNQSGNLRPGLFGARLGSQDLDSQWLAAVKENVASPCLLLTRPDSREDE
ncbi:hypothetical protein B7463_g2114, partial [Scytalidium lignicola]